MARENTLDGLIRQMFGVQTSIRISPVVNQVGVVASVVLRQNPNRLGAVITNLSANTVYLAPDGSVSATHGVRLGPSGGTVSLIWNEDFQLVGLEWFALATGAASDLYAQEVVTEAVPPEA
jgi:hypothetical protein